jgi:benzylsuccinate CoA-transferase BbsE subunit
MTSPEAPQALAGIRVLELAGAMSQYCGKLFAELGADVIFIEPPAGSSLRAVEPYIDDEPGADRSLSFAYFNTSKRGITLDLEKREGQALFRRLAQNADLVIDTTRPGTLTRWGCD